MTDNEIIKALRCCADKGCKFCSEQGKPYCREKVASLAWDLIQRQKAEIEGLKEDKEALINGQITLQNKLPGVIKSEARKEFAERSKLMAEKISIAGIEYRVITTESLDVVLAEMESEEK